MRYLRQLPLKVSAPLALGIVVSLAVLAFSEIGSRRLEEMNRTQLASLEMISTLHEILGLVTDAETGQRGYFLTGRPEYLDPYKAALPKVDERFKRLRELLVRIGTPLQRDQAARINNLVGKKIGELEASLALQEKSGRDAALELMNTGLGKKAMDELRTEIFSLSDAQRQAQVVNTTTWTRDIEYARFAVQIMTASTIALLLVVWFLARREIRLQEERRMQLADERRRLERDVIERTAELTELSTYLQAVREDEKARLARDIHDELGGILVSAKMDVSAVAQKLAGKDGAGADKLGRALAALDEGVTLKRRIIEELRPTLLDNLGLGAALDWQVREVCKRAGLGCELNLCDETADLPPDVAIGLYRIVQEALTNVVKYAKARQVSVELMRDAEGVSLVITDDGIGVPETASHNRLSHGIIGMRQRVRALSGEFAIHGTPGKGTQIEVRIPLAPQVVDTVVTTA